MVGIIGQIADLIAFENIGFICRSGNDQVLLFHAGIYIRHGELEGVFIGAGAENGFIGNATVTVGGHDGNAADRNLIGKLIAVGRCQNIADPVDLVVLEIAFKFFVSKHIVNIDIHNSRCFRDAGGQGLGVVSQSRTAGTERYACDLGRFGGLGSCIQ